MHRSITAIILFLCCHLIAADDSYDVETSSSTTNKLKIEGKVIMQTSDDGLAIGNWQAATRILVNYGEYVGFLRDDGSFAVYVPPGSYVVEVANKDVIFEPYRVDITSKGKIRARKLFHLQPSSVVNVPYPLKFVSKQPAKYFKAREVWRVTDFLMNPMILMMVVPFLLIMVLPKLINTSDPELQREMQQSLQMPKYDLPELSEVMTNIFGGGKKAKPKSIAAKAKK